MRRGNVAAFSLVEIAMALGVAAFCLVAILGLIPIGINSNQASIRQTVAASLARGIVADLRTTPKTNPATLQHSPDFGISFPATTADTPLAHTLFLRNDGTAAAAQDTDATAVQAIYRATITFAPPATVSQKAATGIRVFITWPALADPKAAVAPVNYSGSYEAITSLNRN